MPHNPRVVAAATAACVAIGSAAAVVATRLHREAQKDAALVEEALKEAQEAASLAVSRARRRRGSSVDKGSSRRAPETPRPPRLGLLGLGKFLGLARAGGYLVGTAQLINVLAHRGGGLKRGTFRAKARDAARSVGSAMRVTGATALAASAAVGAALVWKVASRPGRRGSRFRGASLEEAFAGAFEDLGRDLHEWGNKQDISDLQTHSEGEVGWLLRRPDAPKIVDQTTEFHKKLLELSRRRAGGRVSRKLLLDTFGPPRVPGADRAAGWDGVSVLLVPGLWTKWYPLYWVHLRSALDRCAVDYHFSRADSDATSAENVSVVRAEIFALLRGSKRSVLVYAHSKGALDAAAVIHDLSPAEKERVCGFVACQGPFGGAILAHDAIRTNVLSGILDTLFGKLLRGAGLGAVRDLTYDARRAYYDGHREPWWVHPALRGGAAPSGASDRAWVPTVCLCTAATHEPAALMSPIVEYYRYRYGRDGAIDGLCARTDGALPGATCVFLSDMDHFGPAWTGFPAMDRYDSVDLFFVLAALCFHRGTTAAKQARKLRAAPPARRRLDDADELAFEADVSEGFQTDYEEYGRSASSPSGLARITSWGLFGN